MALLEADVSYKVVKEFIAHVTERAVGQEVIRSVTPGQQIVKVVHDELVRLMGPGDRSIPFAQPGPTILMLVGLQGSGKTTTAAKLAKYVQSRGHSPLLVAADVQRPAAIDQLKVLGERLKIPVYSEATGRPVRICQNAREFAVQQQRDALILDTAGRLHIDQQLMAELKDITAKIQPHQKYLVCDAMTGQDAVTSAVEFNNQLNLDGVILTKLDGDARGGAALSIKAVTGKPVKFVGVGEKLESLEEFHPERMASRILGMGDVVSLVEKAQQTVSLEQAAQIQEKIRENTLTLEDFLSQLQQVKKMGPIGDLLKMIPGIGGKIADEELAAGEDQIVTVEAIIRSMTPGERDDPDIIGGSRKRRIAAGSGTTVQDVNMLLKQFKQMKGMLRQMSQGFFGKRMPKMPGRFGRP
jgi:signal recognition particle subunit SRP54